MTVFEEVRDSLLAEMRAEGPDQYLYGGDVTGFPLPWDINNGWCETYGEMVRERLPEAECAWLDELTDDDTVPNHYVVIYRGRYYDAECVDGVTDWRNLPPCLDNPRPVR